MSIVTEKILPCSCGLLPEIRGGQDPTLLVWRFYVRCHNCLNCERGSHITIESAVAAWNGIARRAL